ncbi:MAG TPA: hypothetical protein VKO42_02035, partial [Patescibacteria group bacterium]|nr:hypothetical protein [Patescibacteria group bacterium]
FEIVANQKKIAFYVVAPEQMSRYLEQKIHAYYPEASIEEVEDYNIFNRQGYTAGSILRTKRNFVFPIRTYNNTESDLMNSVINVMSKLGSEESMVTQILVRSSKPAWHRKINKVVREVNQGKRVQEALKTNAFSKTATFILDMFKSEERQAQEKEKESTQKLSAMEEEMLKGMEEKNSKAGLDVNIRVIVCAGDKAQATGYLQNMANAFADFNYYEYGNSFKSRYIT